MYLYWGFSIKLCPRSFGLALGLVANVDNYFLTSEHNGIFAMYSVGSKWSREKIVAFLKKVRNSNFE